MQLLTVLTTGFIQITPRWSNPGTNSGLSVRLTPAPHNHSESSLMGSLEILHPTSISYSTYSFIRLATHTPFLVTCILPQPPYFRVLVLWVTILHTPPALTPRCLAESLADAGGCTKSEVRSRNSRLKLEMPSSFAAEPEIRTFWW
jgi:hypothetical protein